MLNKNIPHYSLVLFKTDTKNYPEYTLPEGYRFVFYKKGDEAHWAEIERSVGQFNSVEEGLRSFHASFVNGQDLVLEERMIFVVDSNGEYVATSALWNGKYLGEEKQRVHWVAVKDKCAGKGIAKAMLSFLMKLYNDLGYEDFIFLDTGTRNYAAINIYRHFGFTEYTGEKPPFGNMSDEEFKRKNEIAISMVNEKISQSFSKRIMDKNIPENVRNILNERFGHDTLIALATSFHNTPYVRGVNAYYEDGRFYIITYALSNKMKHIQKNPVVGVCGDWFSAHGAARDMGHVLDPRNEELINKLRSVFSSWYGNGHVNEDDENTHILCIRLTDGILMDNGERYELKFL